LHCPTYILIILVNRATRVAWVREGREKERREREGEGRKEGCVYNKYYICITIYNQE